MINNNIDKSDSVYNTSYPFVWGSALKLGDMRIPNGAILTIKIAIKEEMKLPVRLYSVAKNDRTPYKATFKDATGSVAGIWEFGKQTTGNDDYNKSFITDTTGSVIGHLVYKPDLTVMLAAALMLSGDDEVKSAYGDFTLLDRCCYPALSGGLKAVSVNGKIQRGDITIDVGQYMRATGSAEAGLSISVAGNYRGGDSGTYGITKLRVNEVDYDINGKHILLLSGITSNLRVMAPETGGIELMGVADVNT